MADDEENDSVGYEQNNEKIETAESPREKEKNESDNENANDNDNDNDNEKQENKNDNIETNNNNNENNQTIETLKTEKKKAELALASHDAMTDDETKTNDDISTISKTQTEDERFQEYNEYDGEVVLIKNKYQPSAVLRLDPHYKIDENKYKYGKFQLSGHLLQDWNTIETTKGGELADLTADWIELFFDLIYVAGM